LPEELAQLLSSELAAPPLVPLQLAWLAAVLSLPLHHHAVPCTGQHNLSSCKTLQKRLTARWAKQVTAVNKVSTIRSCLGMLKSKLMADQQYGAQMQPHVLNMLCYTLSMTACY